MPATHAVGGVGPAAAARCAVHSEAGMALNLPPLASLSGDEAHIDRVELDPASYLAHRLSPAERQQFEDDGVSRDTPPLPSPSPLPS